MFRKSLLALAVLLFAPATYAATCSASVEGNDAMKFNVTNIDVSKSCSEFTVTLKHTGKLAKNVMGHNFVVSKTADMAGVAADGMKAAATDYVKAGDARVVAHSKVVGGGESTTVKIPVAKLSAGPYSFFCSFPGHSALMKGTLTLKP